MHHTTKFLSKIIGIFTASFLIFAPNVASAAMPTAQQIYDFYDAGGPNCWASNAEDFCANYGGCLALGWWEYREKFCYDDTTVDPANGYFPAQSTMYPPADVVDALNLSSGSIDFSSFEPDQIIRNGESDNYSDTELKCMALFELYGNGAIPLINMSGPNYGWQNNIVWWNGQTVSDPLVGYALAYYAYDIYDAIQYAHQQTGTQFPTDVESHSNYAMQRLGISCDDYNWPDAYIYSQSDYQMDCYAFSEIWDYAINMACPSSANDTGGWIMSMYPDNSYSSNTLATMYKNTYLYNAFCETCSESLWGTSGCSQYDIAKSATVQNVNTCNFDNGGTNSYVVTYDLQGGSWGGTPTTQDIMCDESFQIYYDSFPTKSGYTFGGFYDQTNCNGTQYVGANAVSSAYLASTNTLCDDTTLYACWISNTTYSLNYSSIDMAMAAAGNGNIYCYGSSQDNGPVLVQCDCRTSVADLTGEPEFLYEIEMPSFAQTNCPTSGVPASAMADLSCSLSGTFSDYSQGRLLCVSQDLLGGDNCSDICGCGNPWGGEILSSQQTFYGDGSDCITDANDDLWCIKTSSDTSYLYREILLDDPEYMPGCYANETVLYGCAANMYYDNSGNADDGAWCSSCPSYTLADGTSQPGTLAALTHSPAITQCTVPTTSILRGTNGNYKYKNACAYTQ